MKYSIYHRRRRVGIYFWAAILGVDSGIIVFITLMMMNVYSVFYWCWDTIYGVWLYLGISAIVGVSFGASKLKPIKRKTIKLKSPRLAGGGASSQEYQPQVQLVKG